MGHLRGTKRSLPVSRCHQRMKSLARLYPGYWNVAGLFRSKKKCPNHAKP